MFRRRARRHHHHHVHTRGHEDRSGAHPPVGPVRGVPGGEQQQQLRQRAPHRPDCRAHECHGRLARVGPCFREPGPPRRPRGKGDRVPRPALGADGRPRRQGWLHHPRAGCGRAHAPLERHGGQPRLCGMQRQDPSGSVRPRVHPRRGRGQGGLQEDRVPHHAQGVLGRGREGHPHGAERGARRGALLAGERGGARVPHLRDAARAPVPPPGGAAAGGRARQRLRGALPRLLHPAPPPEDHRGGPLHRCQPRDPPRDGARCHRARQARRVRGRGYRGVPLRDREQGLLLPRAQPAPPGRAPGVGVDLRCQPPRVPAYDRHGHSPAPHARHPPPLREGRGRHRRD
mmetsp:Transcript_29724/g.95551  ORF Transcript_29724/g.95551 Transcript_29724/m.95551 type:complete len:344 (-) Transcript_29724:2260-3291(-)